jgi:phenol 2-monooxygenase (NADPH)
MFQRYFQQQGRFTAGVATRYPTGSLTGPREHQHLAEGFTVGMRFHSAPVIRFCDAKPMHLGHVHQADGRWRLYAFGDDATLRDPVSRLAKLCQWLIDDDASPIVQYTLVGSDIDAVFDVRAILQQSHDTVEHDDLPRLLRPRKGTYQLIDYEKVFCPDTVSKVDVFDLRTIDRRAGALVVVRPDQYISQVLPLDGFDELTAFFKTIFLPPHR